MMTVLETPQHETEPLPMADSSRMPGVRRIQDPQGKEARRSSCRFLAPGACADREHGLISRHEEHPMTTSKSVSFGPSPTCLHAPPAGLLPSWPSRAGNIGRTVPANTDPAPRISFARASRPTRRGLAPSLDARGRGAPGRRLPRLARQEAIQAVPLSTAELPRLYSEQGKPRVTCAMTPTPCAASVERARSDTSSGTARPSTSPATYWSSWRPTNVAPRPAIAQGRRRQDRPETVPLRATAPVRQSRKPSDALPIAGHKSF